MSKCGAIAKILAMTNAGERAETMSVQVLVWVLENSEARLGHRLVLLSIANHAHSDGTGCTASLQTLANESRMSRRQVIRAIAWLEKHGHLTVNRSASEHVTNAYTILGVPPPNEKASDKMASPAVLSGCHQWSDKSGLGLVTNQPGNPPEMSPEPKAKPITKPKDSELGFEDFMAVWPGQANRRLALQQWVSLNPSSALSRQIIENVKLRARGEQWRRGGGRFIPAAQNYLRDRRWEDRLLPEESNGKTDSPNRGGVPGDATKYANIPCTVVR